MRTASVSELVAAARYHINEEIANESLVLSDVGDGADDSDIDAVVASHIVEALDCVHSLAPVDMLDGLSAVRDTDYTLTVTDKVIPDIVMLKPMLRLVSLRAKDTPFDVREVHPEGSPEGLMQLNPYVRGTWDRPRLVMRADTNDWLVHLRYYSLREESDGEDNPIEEFIYVPKQFHGADSYLISSMLFESTINYITALTLNTYGEYDRANVYFQRAKNE